MISSCTHSWIKIYLSIYLSKTAGHFHIQLDAIKYLLLRGQIRFLRSLGTFLDSKNKKFTMCFIRTGLSQSVVWVILYACQVFKSNFPNPERSLIPLSTLQHGADKKKKPSCSKGIVTARNKLVRNLVRVVTGRAPPLRAPCKVQISLFYNMPFIYWARNKYLYEVATMLQANRGRSYNRN